MDFVAEHTEQTGRIRMGNLWVEPCVVGMIGTNCYIVYRKDGQKADGEYVPAVVIDPGDNAPLISNRCRELGVKPEVILLTHGHFDHILVVEDMRRSFDVPVYAGEKEKALLSEPSLNLSGTGREGVSLEAQRWLKEGETVNLLGEEWKILFTPGHTEGSICYYVEKEQALFSGDTLFCRSVGRTDLPTGDSSRLVESVTGLLSDLPEETRVYPGHGEGSSIGYERKRNPMAQYVR